MKFLKFELAIFVASLTFSALGWKKVYSAISVSLLLISLIEFSASVLESRIILVLFFTDLAKYWCFLLSLK